MGEGRASFKKNTTKTVAYDLKHINGTKVTRIQTEPQLPLSQTTIKCRDCASYHEGIFVLEALCYWGRTEVQAV